MQTKSQLMHAYNQIALEHGGYRRKPWPELASFIKPIKNELVLDVGAGTCSTTRDLITNNKVVALDFSFEFLKRAPDIIKVCADAAHLPFKQASFDAVVAVGVLHHLFSEEERADALKEIKRVLKPECRAFISVWKNTDAKEKLVKWGKYKRYYYFFEPEELEMLTKLAGFSKLQIKESKENLFLECQTFCQHI